MCKHEFKKYLHDQGLKFILVVFLFCLLGKGKYSPGRVEVLPLDLSSGEESLKEAVQKAESLFSGAGVDYMVHNAAFERPVSIALFIFSIFTFFVFKFYISVTNCSWSSTWWIILYISKRRLNLSNFST